MELNERIKRISSKEDLADFVSALRADLATNPQTWENSTLDRFLEAMEAWISAMDGYYKNTGQRSPDSPGRKTFAEMLMAAKMYES